MRTLAVGLLLFLPSIVIGQDIPALLNGVGNSQYRVRRESTEKLYAALLEDHSVYPQIQERLRDCSPETELRLRQVNYLYFHHCFDDLLHKVEHEAPSVSRPLIGLIIPETLHYFELPEAFIWQLPQQERFTSIVTPISYTRIRGPLPTQYGWCIIRTNQNGQLASSILGQTGTTLQKEHSDIALSLYMQSLETLGQQFHIYLDPTALNHSLAMRYATFIWMTNALETKTVSQIRDILTTMQRNQEHEDVLLFDVIRGGTVEYNGRIRTVEVPAPVEDRLRWLCEPHSGMDIMLHPVHELNWYRTPTGDPPKPEFPG